MSYYHTGGEKKDIIKMNRKLQIKKVWRLSVPAILTQIATIVMQYIDSAMVGNLGGDASASIGLVSTSTWLIGGIIAAVAVGFSVQIAHNFGAEKYQEARCVLRHGLITSILISLILMVIAILVSEPLPRWLGADQSIWQDASLYFFVYALSIPFLQLNNFTSSSLQCSGNMIIPSILNVVMCLLDVIFNAIFIPKYQVLGASIGTTLAVVVTSLLMFYFCCIRNYKLSITIKDHTKFDKRILVKALKIGTPIALEQVARSAAMIVSTTIVAPLGNVAIAANSFAVTAESLCYMLGFGIASASTTLVGQEMGAKNFKQAKSYGNISIAFGVILMSIASVFMFILCPFVFMFLTPVEEIRIYAASVLRIGLFAEPLYGASIVATGALRGAEDTFVPSVINLVTMWFIRIPLSYLLVTKYALYGVWIANSIELCIRGLLMLLRQKTTKNYTKLKENKVTLST